MARRSDHTREELYELTLAAAREIAEEEGVRGLTARRVAGKIGYSPGTLYNLFENLDDLIVHLNATTLDALYEACVAEPRDGEPEEALRALARNYVRFTGEHPNLWSILFEHSLPHGQQPPDWYHDKVRRLFGLAEGALAPLFAPGQEAERLHTAHVLWSSVHGMCSLAAAGALAESESIPAMADSLIVNYLAGLRYRASGFTGASISA